MSSRNVFNQARQHRLTHEMYDSLWNKKNRACNIGTDMNSTRIAYFMYTCYYYLFVSRSSSQITNVEMEYINNNIAKRYDQNIVLLVAKTIFSSFCSANAFITSSVLIYVLTRLSMNMFS